jgi:hypothetical protein
MHKATIATVAALAAMTLAASAGIEAAPMSKGPAPVASGSPCGGPLGYNSAEINYLHTSFDESSVDDAKGAAIDITFSPFQNVYLTTGGSWQTLDIGDVNVDNWGILVGVGGYLPLADNVHLAMDGGVIFSGTSIDDSDSTETLGYVRPHLRAKFGCFETHLGAKYIWGEDDGTWEGFANAYFQVAPQVDLTAGVIFNEFATTVNGGVRFRF